MKLVSDSSHKLGNLLKNMDVRKVEKALIISLTRYEVKELSNFTGLNALASFFDSLTNGDVFSTLEIHNSLSKNAKKGISYLA